MATITIPGMFLTGTHAARPAATAVGGGSIYSCTDHALIYQSDGSAWSTWATLGGTPTAADVTFTPAGTIAATDVQAAIEEVASEAGAGGAVGNTLNVYPPGFSVSPGSTLSLASLAQAMPIVIPAPMLVRGIMARVTTGAAGTNQWGLFQYDSSPASATKLAGGTGALGSTGWVGIAAASAPVSVAAGAYMLVFHYASASQPTIGRTTLTASSLSKEQGSYVWDDTPNFTSGWSDSGSAVSIYLEGDLDASNQW